MWAKRTRDWSSSYHGLLQEKRVSDDLEEGRVLFYYEEGSAVRLNKASTDLAP